MGDLIGEGASQEQAVVGDTPNLAARLQALAEPGTVVISASTRRLTGGHFEYRDLGPVELKGWVEPIVAWQVLRASGVESRFEAQHESRLTPLFGRDEEIDLLLRRWRLATQGEGRVVVLTGDPGIGKSHIALALQERLQAEPHTTLHYFCSAHYANSALFPFIGQLERAARFKRGDSPAEKLAKLETLIVQSTVDGDQPVALLANLLSLPLSDRYRLPELSSAEPKVEDTGGAFGAVRVHGSEAASADDLRRCPLDRPDLAGATHGRRGRIGRGFGCCSSSPHGRSLHRPGHLTRMSRPFS